MSRMLRLVLGLFALAAAAVSAQAQDYTKTETSGQLLTRPSDATVLPITTDRNASYSEFSAIVDLPFTFRYYGMATDVVTVGPCAYILPRAVERIDFAENRLKYHGQHPISRAFPFTQDGLGGAGDQNTDGVIAALWGSLEVNNSWCTGRVWTWVTGTAPSRVFVASWEDVKTSAGDVSPITIQIHLHETTGRIVFAYDPDGTYFESGAGYACGIDSPLDARFTCPLATQIAYLNPGADFFFDPHTRTVTGTVRYDRLVTDATGIGNSTVGDVPLAGLTVAVRRPSDHIVYASSTVAADGGFSVTHIGLPAAEWAELVIDAQNDAVTVGPAAGGLATSWLVEELLAIQVDVDVGTVTFGSDDDPNGDVRSALHVALTCAAARAFVAEVSSDQIPKLDVVLDPAAASATAYSPAAGTTPARLTLGSRAAANPDAWDEAVVTRTYARHLLASIAAPSATTFDDRYDAVTDTPNAFAAGFGHALWGAIAGASSEPDGTSASAATVLDLESPEFTAATGPDHAGRVAAALFDLTDPANESTDPVDGTGANRTRWLAATDALSTAVTFDAFVQSWIDVGYDAAAVTRVAIAAGAFSDDDREANDFAAEATAFGPPGTLLRDLVLRRYNEDWFAVTVAEPTPTLVAGVTHGVDDSAELEIRSASGALLATGSPIPNGSRVVGATGPIQAGTYHIRVRNSLARTIPRFTLQVFLPVSVPAQPFIDWTVGRPYDQPLGLSGGIPPYTMSLATGGYPPGLYPNLDTLRGVGAPVETGTFAFSLRVLDSGEPANLFTRDVTVRIHPPLEIRAGRFLAVPLDRPASSPIPTAGGTPPFALDVTGGALPEGLSVATEPLRLAGAATAPGLHLFSYAATDRAGSPDAGDLAVVVCSGATAKPAPVDLEEGAAACGVWIDAVRGSTIKFAAKTLKRMPKRPLAAVVLGPDQLPVASGKVVGRNGTASGSAIVCSVSGRYYVVLSSEAGAATSLLVSATATAPSKAKPVKVREFGMDSVTEVGIGALPGARLSFKATGDRKAGLVPLCVGLVAPDGTLAAVEGALRTSPTGFTLTADLPRGGTWTVRIAGNPQAVVPGTLTWSWTVKQPKGAVWSSD